MLNAVMVCAFETRVDLHSRDKDPTDRVGARLFLVQQFEVKEPRDCR